MNLSWTADGEPDERCLSLLRPPAPHRQARGLLRGVRVSDMTPRDARSLSRVTPQRLAREFKGGLTVVGLARKYALRRQQVEDWIRSVARGRR